jgi:trans-2,3-dihydro-3-hydroxyanthranilate isomerase
MKYTFHIVDVFSSTPFGGNQLAVLPDAAGISTEGMQRIAREFNFGETTFVLPKNDPANTCRVRIFTPRAKLDFAGHPTVGAACALVPPSSAPWHRSMILAGRPIAFRSSKVSRWGAEAKSKRRRVRAKAA